MKNRLVMALPKGRIFTKAKHFLSSAGIDLDDQAIDQRKLFIETSKSNLFATIIRNTDTPVYTALGVTDMAVLGRDSLDEAKDHQGLYDLLDLGIARCKLMVASKKGYQRSAGRITVATKFTNIACRYYSSLGIQADVIKLNGSVELAAVIDLADEIVDLVETGQTLEKNDLHPSETIMKVSSHLVVNTNSMVLKHKAIMELVELLETTIES